MATEPGDERSRLQRVRLESDTLYALIDVIGSAPDLDRVLERVVAVLTQATDCHACFVYLRYGTRLKLRAASRVFAHLVGLIEFGVGEGLAGWVTRTRRSAFIRENALADPRTNFIPQLREERFQSMVAVPIPARAGEVIGVIVLHTQAPREFDDDVLNVLEHTAVLVAGAIENARLYEDTRRRADTLKAATELSQEIAGVTRREDLYRTVTDGVSALLQAAGCQLYVFDADREHLELVRSSPPGEADVLDGPQGTVLLLNVLRQRARQPAGASTATTIRGAQEARELLAAPIAAGDDELGVLAVIRDETFTTDEDELLRSLANQVAVAVKRADLIEQLHAENVVHDLFGALSAGSEHDVATRAIAAGLDTDRPYVLLSAGPAPTASKHAWAAATKPLADTMRQLASTVLVDSAEDRLRALLVLGPRHSELPQDSLAAALEPLARDEGLSVGISTARTEIREGRQALREAEDALEVTCALSPAGGALPYSELGAYKYLVKVPLDQPVADRYVDAVTRLLEYDQRRRGQLLPTLELYLRNRHSATTAQSLYVHPNTLRQRLSRVEEIAGLDLRTEDLLSLELAIKMVRLSRAAAARAAAS